MLHSSHPVFLSLGFLNLFVIFGSKKILLKKLDFGKVDLQKTRRYVSSFSLIASGSATAIFLESDHLVNPITCFQGLV